MRPATLLALPVLAGLALLAFAQDRESGPTKVDMKKLAADQAYAVERLEKQLAELDQLVEELRARGEKEKADLLDQAMAIVRDKRIDVYGAGAEKTGERLDDLFDELWKKPAPVARDLRRSWLLGLGAYRPAGWIDGGLKAPPLQLSPSARLGNSLNVDPITGRSFFQ